MSEELKHKELTHEVSVNVLPSSGLKLSLGLTSDNQDALKESLNILSVPQFESELIFKGWRKGGVKVKGRFFAELERECVVTLEPLTEEIKEDFERTFLPKGSKLAKPEFNEEGEMVLDPDGADIPDLFSGNTLDAWEILIEQVLLAMDPFPRTDNADISVHQAPEEELAPKQSPFAVLKSLKSQK